MNLAPITFVAGEVLTSTKMNALGNQIVTNDIALSNGSGLEEDSISFSKLSIPTWRAASTAFPTATQTNSWLTLIKLGNVVHVSGLLMANTGNLPTNTANFMNIALPSDFQPTGFLNPPGNASQQILVFRNEISMTRAFIEQTSESAGDIRIDTGSVAVNQYVINGHYFIER